MSGVFQKLVDSKIYDTNIDIYDESIDIFLSKYFICEAYAKELQKMLLYENNRNLLVKQFEKVIGKTLTEQILNSKMNNLNMMQFKIYKETQNNVDISILKKIIPSDQFEITNLEMIFYSKPIKISDKNVKTARILRNQIVHSLSLSAINEVKDRYKELVNLMSNFIDLFKQ